MNGKKRLFLLRHAKSDWHDPALDDFHRPLSKRGRKAAVCMGKEMQHLELRPELVLCSAAVRAKSTWELISQVIEPSPDVAFFDTLYLAAAGAILEHVQACQERIGSVLVIGHNPGLEALAIHLAGIGSDIGALARMKEKYPTAALAEIRSGTSDWRQFDRRNTCLERFLRPADLT